MNGLNRTVAEVGPQGAAAETAGRIASVNLRYRRPPVGPRARAWRWLLRLAGQVRRQYLCRFRPAYVARMASERRGECLQCGACCHLTFHCPFLTPERRCTVYHKRSRTCRDFPIDAADLRLTRVPCGHHFDSRREEEARADSSG